MGESKNNTRIGLSFGAEEIFLVQIEDAAKQYKITSLADVTSSIPFSLDLLSESSGAEMVGLELRNTLDQHNIATRDLAISLDLNLGVIVKLPYDRKLSDKDLKSHLGWELEQYIDDDIDEYIFDSYKLIQAPSMRQPELVLYTVPQLVGHQARPIAFVLR